MLNSKFKSFRRFAATLLLTAGLVTQPLPATDALADTGKILNFGGYQGDYFNSVVATADGGYVAVGDSTSNDGDLPGNKGSNDAVIAKFDSYGNKMWLKNFGGSGGDDFFSVITTADGGYVAVGYTSSSNGDLTATRGSTDALIVKFDAAGNRVWQGACGGSAADYFRSVTATSDGGFVAVGYTASANGNIATNRGGNDFLIAKFTATGQISWVKTYGGSNQDYFYSVVADTDGGFVAAGYSSSSSGTITINSVNIASDLPGNMGGNDAIIAKFNSLGEKVWFKNYGGSSSDYFYTVRRATDGGFIAAGQSSSTNGDFRAGGAVAKFNTRGEKIWTTAFGNSTSVIRSIATLSDGSFVAAGDSQPNAASSIRNAWVLKAGAAGNEIWQGVYGGSDDGTSNVTYFYSVAAALDGGFVAAGYSYATGGYLLGNKGSADAILAKFNATGTLLYPWIAPPPPPKAKLLAFKNVNTPKVGGVLKPGKTVRVQFAKKWSPAPKYKYQWLRNGKAIKGATKATYKLKDIDATKKISVKVTGSRVGYKTVVKASKAVKIAKLKTKKAVKKKTVKKSKPKKSTGSSSSSKPKSCVSGSKITC